MKIKFKGKHLPLYLLFITPTLFGFIINAYYPSDVISFFDEWKITLGDGDEVKNLVNYKNSDYFLTESDDEDWVVYKTPNTGGTTSNSSNTRSELRQLEEWTPEMGGKLTGTLKVMHVSTTGDKRVPASFSVVVGQIHSDEGNENEPIKIFYKKYPDHTKGSVFWNYEINTEGSNSERWDYCTAVWGDNWSVLGQNSTTSPSEPSEGIELGEVFSYEINVYQGVMYVTFKSDGHATKTFTKSLISSEYSSYSSIPSQVLTVFSSTGQDGIEQEDAYAKEDQYFKQGAYNQTNAKDPDDNMVWNTGGKGYDGDLDDQYNNGSYAEVWFSKAYVGRGTPPSTVALSDDENINISIYPNPASSYVQIESTTYSIKSIQLFDISGKSIVSNSNIGLSSFKLDIENIELGTYFLVVEDENNYITIHKIIKE